MTDEDPRIVPDHTGIARLLIYAGVPAGLFSVALVFTIGLSWGRPEGLCGTWMAFMLPYCG
jgi:hypothetical protein